MWTYMHKFGATSGACQKRQPHVCIRKKKLLTESLKKYGTNETTN